MPTILEKDGFRIIIRTGDHNPPHVHVEKADGQIKIALGSETESIEIVKVWMSRSDAKKAVAIVEENRMHLLAKWREIYGEQDLR